MVRPLAAIALVLAASLARAGGIDVVGLFPGKAVVAIDGGAPRAMAVGESIAGVKLVAVGRDDATFVVDGRRLVVAMGSYVQRGGGASQAVKLVPDSRGHYVTDGTINGRTVRFLVDTGATLLSMSMDDAKRIGLDVERATRAATDTANGRIGIRLVKLDTVRIGDVELHNVDAAVIEGAYAGPILLGMSFLSRTAVSRDGETMVLTRRF